MMIVGIDSGSMTDAALQHAPLVSALGAGVSIGIIGREVEASEDIGYTVS